MPNNDNKTTLESYQAKLQEYIDNTPEQINAVESPWLDQALTLAPGKKVLELGSGFGRNAVHVQAKGYDIACTDAVDGFIKILQSKGLQARFLDALTDDFGGTYSMVLANGVLVHFTPEETALVVKKVHDSLTKDGIFAFSVKQGDGNEWTDEKLGAPRFFQYWQPEPLKEMIESLGFTRVALLDGHTSSGKASWLYVIAKKC